MHNYTFVCAVESREQITTLLTDLGCSQADVSSRYTDTYTYDNAAFVHVPLIAYSR